MYTLESLLEQHSCIDNVCFQTPCKRKKSKAQVPGCQVNGVLNQN